MAQADYIKGEASGHDDLLAIIVGIMTSPDNKGGQWSKVQDYVDAAHNGDGERHVVLKSAVTGELPVYIGLRTFTGYAGKFQQGIQINAYTNFDPDLPWDCQAGSLALPEMYNAASHFYEGCPAILVGNEPLCYWICADAKRLIVVARTAVLPLSDDDRRIKDAVCYEMFYLGWLKRVVSKEGYPYPMCAAGTTYTLGSKDIGYVQRNFAYNDILGSLRHIPPFHHDYMMYEGIQPMVTTYSTGAYYTGQVQTPWPIPYQGQPPTITPTNPGGLFQENPLCGPDLELLFLGDDLLPKKLKEMLLAGPTIFQYDVMNFANRVLYFDGTWGWYAAYPARNAFLKSLCWCTHRIQQCASRNFLEDVGCPPPWATYAGSVRKDQVAAHFGWNPSKVISSLSGQRLLVPVYLSSVNSIPEMQSHTRSELGTIDYAEEQRRMHVCGLMDGVYYVPGLGLAAQDLLKVQDGSRSINHLVVQDVYRRGPFNLAAVRLGETEWHDANVGVDTPRDHG